MTVVLISDHAGNHSPEKWAAATAEFIFPIADSSLIGPTLVEAKQKELDLIKLLMGHYKWHQNDEREKLKASPESILTALKTEAKSVTSRVVSLMNGSPWEQHFSDPEVQQAVEMTIQSHTVTNRHMERQYHADIHPHCPYARTFKGIA